MSTIHAIYGSGGYAREVMPLLRGFLAASSQKNCDALVYIDDFSEDGPSINGVPVLTFEKFLKKYKNHKKECAIAIADSSTRRYLTTKCEENDVRLLSIRAPNSIVMDNVVLGSGLILSPFATITSNVSIGKSFHANLYSYVAHDCVVGDFVTFAPCVKCNGNVIIEDEVYVGTGAIIYPGTKEKPRIIGRQSKIAAGAVVTKNVDANITVIGNPAKYLDKGLLRSIRSEK